MQSNLTASSHDTLTRLISYDIFAINIASVMIGYLYSRGNYGLRIVPGTLTNGFAFAGQKTTINQDLGLKVATPIGNIFGQLLFGWLADVVGRKRMCAYHGIIALFSELMRYLKMV